MGWLESQGVEPRSGKVILFKRVSFEFKTQEKTRNETMWKIGSNVVIEKFTPKQSECGEGKFHACSRPFFCDEFRSIATDVYVAIEIAVGDLFAWPNAGYPHKIAFRAGKVLYQCDKFGKQIAK